MNFILRRDGLCLVVPFFAIFSIRRARVGGFARIDGSIRRARTWEDLYESRRIIAFSCSSRNKFFIGGQLF